MITDITIGRYIHRQSPVHKLDPRTKIAATLIMILGLFFVQSFSGYLYLTLFLLLILTFSHLRIGYLWKGIKPLIFIITFTFLAHLFFTGGGNLLVQLGPLSIYQEGLRQGLFLSLRIIYLVLFTTFLTLTTSPLGLTDGLEYMLSPLKRVGFPAHEISMMMTIALRFIPTLLQEADKIMKAQMSRGADFTSGHLVRRAKNFIPLLVPLFISAFRRAEELSLAMEARAYRGGEGRTRMKELQFKRGDSLGLALPILVSLLAVFS